MEFKNVNEMEMNEANEAIVEFDDFNTEIESEDEKSGISTLAAMAIGAGITAATIGVVKLAKKGIRKLKSKKAKSKIDEEEIEYDDIEAEYEDISER